MVSALLSDLCLLGGCCLDFDEKLVDVGKKVYSCVGGVQLYEEGFIK